MANERTSGPVTSIRRMCLPRAMTALLAATPIFLFVASPRAYPQNEKLPRPNESMASMAMHRANSQSTTSTTSAAKTGSFIIFDVPGSTCKESFSACTTASGIDDQGTVIGSYADANQAFHGFLRFADGTFLNIDVPGSACAAEYSVCTSPAAINSEGTVTGYYCDAVTCQGFLRDLYGNYTTFAPAESLFLLVNGINEEGDVIGQYCNGSSDCPAFVRDRHGKITTFDAPGEVNGNSPTSINDEGDIVGTYYDANYLSYGYRRDCRGRVTPLNGPGGDSVHPASINDLGEIVGFYRDSAYNSYGFLLTGQDHYTAITGYPVAINLFGATAGQTGGSGGAGSEGFYRMRNGNVASFLPPTALYIDVTAMNSEGTVAGWFIDPEYLGHGFIWRDN
jgi:hypothetical protein